MLSAASPLALDVRQDLPAGAAPKQDETIQVSYNIHQGVTPGQPHRPQGHPRDWNSKEFRVRCQASRGLPPLQPITLSRDVPREGSIQGI